MADPADYVILFLDVDGTLIPFRSRPVEPALVAAFSFVPAGDEAWQSVAGAA